MEENLFYGGELPSKKAKDKGFYWVTTRLLRESGPWYGGFIKSPEDVCRLVNEHLELEDADREYFVCIYLDRKRHMRG
jgi:DNA repair protein RadC